jgi:hypothetical protein
MEGRGARIMVAVALGIVLLEDVVYVALIRAQDELAPDAYTFPFVAGYLLAMAALLGLSLVRAERIVAVRTSLRAGAAGGLLVLGIVAALSIGLPLVVAGMLATGAAVRTVRGPLLTRAGLAGVGAALLSVAVLVGGFEVTERLIVCPSTGSMTGGGSGFVTGPYHYECTDGRLDFHPGS